MKEVVGPEAENVTLAWRFPGANSEDVETLNLLAQVLYNGQAGLIDLDINQQQKMLGAAAYPFLLADYSVFLMEGTPKNGQTLEEVRTLLLEEIGKLKKGEFDENLIAATINNNKRDRQKQLESNEDRATWFVESFVNGTNWADEVASLDRMSKITKQQKGVLSVPDVPTIPFITGDGVGAEITPAMQAIVDAAVDMSYGGARRIEWKEVLAGERAFRATGSWLPDETMEVFKEYLIGIKGPLTTPVGGGIRSLNVALRQTLDLYVCLRPVRWFRGVVSPVKEPEKVNMYIFRENTEDIYAGIEWEAGTPEAKKFYRFLHEEMGVSKVRFPETSSFGVKPVSREGTERLVRAACRYALQHELPSVTLVHKGNIMKFTEGGFKKWGYELAEREFADALASGKLVIKDCIADAFLQNTLLIPEEYSVIATLNLNGDYISDQLAAMVGLSLIHISEPTRH